MLVYAVALWGVGLAGGYALGLGHVDVGALATLTPMGARGFWLAAAASLAVAGGAVTLYFLYVSREQMQGAR
jgi:MATE family multidrug resistance protein